MALAASSILNKVSKILQDEDIMRRWPVDTELLGWLDSAQREVALMRPELFSSTATRQLVAGSRQTLPATAVGLAAVLRNMGSDGLTPGPTILPKAQRVLDILLPDWQSATHASATVSYFCYDPKNPREYLVYPPQPAVGMSYVEEQLHVAPTALASIDATIGLDDTYENVLLDLVLSRAYGKDADIPRCAERANTYRASALERLGLSLQARAANIPGGEE